MQRDAGKLFERIAPGKQETQRNTDASTLNSTKSNTVSSFKRLGFRFGPPKNQGSGVQKFTGVVTRLSPFKQAVVVYTLGNDTLKIDLDQHVPTSGSNRATMLRHFRAVQTEIISLSLGRVPGALASADAKDFRSWIESRNAMLGSCSDCPNLVWDDVVNLHGLQFRYKVDPQTAIAGRAIFLVLPLVHSKVTGRSPREMATAVRQAMRAPNYQQQPPTSIARDTQTAAPKPSPQLAQRQPLTDGGLVAETQRLLNELGYDAGSVDGLYGGKTRRAIEAFQRDQELVPDGQVSNELVSRLGTAAAATSTTTPATAKTPVPMILVIDGFDPGVYDPTGLFSNSSGRVDSYLMPKIKTSWAEFWDLQEWKNLHQVIWSGDPTSTALAVGTARVDIQQLLYAKSETQPLVIVTHSWGNVIAYRALIDLSEQGILKPGDVDTFISMGSPLNAQRKILRAFTRRLYQWSGPAPAANAVQQWRNYYIEPADKISGPIPGTDANVTNIAVPYTGSADDLWTAHSAYHKDSRFLRQIGMELRNALAASTPQLAGAPTSGTGVTTQPQTSITEQSLTQDSLSRVCLFDICLGATPAEVQASWKPIRSGSGGGPWWLDIVGLDTSDMAILEQHTIHGGELIMVDGEALAVLDTATAFCARRVFVGTVLSASGHKTSVFFEPLTDVTGARHTLRVFLISRTYENMPKHQWPSVEQQIKAFLPQPEHDYYYRAEFNHQGYTGKVILRDQDKTRSDYEKKHALLAQHPAC